MTRIILEAENSKDILLIRELAEKLKIKYEIHDLVNLKKTDKESLESYYQLIGKGVDVSNYGEPSSWQKKVREDRNNNFS